MSNPDNNPILESAKSVKSDQARQIEGAREGQPSVFTCPECGGVLWQVNEPDFVQFRCHVGHIVTADFLLEEQRNAAEDALWTAVRTLEDRTVLGRQLSRFAIRHNDNEAAQRYEFLVQKAEKKYRTLLKIVETGDEEDVE